MTEYQSFLLKLNRNLNTLRERESKYGGNAPLELLNQIEDHQHAIALTEQALEDEITEVEWKETTKHLLAFSGGQVINIEAETYVAGDQITHIHKGPEEPPFWHRLSRANLVLAIVVGVFSIVGAIAAVLAVPGLSDYTYNFFRPLPFPSATHEETLIVIATFHHTEGVADTDAHNEIRRAIEAAATELNVPHLRVEVEPTRLTGDDQDAARKLGERYRASMVIWGSDTGVRVTVNFLNLKEPDYDAAAVKISETKRTQLANPSAYAQFITEDLPSQLTFLALFAVGRSYDTQADYPQAIRVIEKALAALPSQVTSPQGEVEAYFYLGWLYQNQNQHDQAIAIYDKAIELNYQPLAGFYINRGAAYAAQGDYQRAIADCTKAIELDPKDKDLYLIRGDIYKDQGDYQRAIADFTKAIELDPKYKDLYLIRADVYEGQGDYQRAIADYTKAIELDPKDAATYDSRALAYAAQGDYPQAVADYTKIIELDPKDVSGYLARGFVYYVQGDYQRAIGDYTKIIELDPKDASAYDNRGFVYYSQGDYQQAIADYTKAIELDPKYVDAYNNRGNAYKNQGDYEQAIADYDRAIELDPKNADFWNSLCWTGSLAGAAAEVMDACEQAVKLAPDEGRNHDSRALARTLTGDYQGAIEDFKFFVEWSKQNSQYEQYGRRREAWIAELEAGRNPFDEATLEELRKE